MKPVEYRKVQKVQYWKTAEGPPASNMPVWGWCPDLGNDSEGYGSLIVVRCEFAGLNRFWIDSFGKQRRITLWAYLLEPELPEEPTDTRPEQMP